jgi:hypothetical protein
MKGLRYQKRVKLLPFLWLNISKNGKSVTLGGRWLKVNIGRRGVWLTGSMAGTGLSYRKQVGTTSKRNNAN